MDAQTKEYIDRQFEKTNTLLKGLLAEKKKQTWVKCSSILELTGWNREKLRRMRENGIVAYKKDNKGIFYCIESINPIFFKHENTTTVPQENGKLFQPGV